MSYGGQIELCVISIIVQVCSTVKPAVMTESVPPLPSGSTVLFGLRDWAGVIGFLAFILGALMYYLAFFRLRLIPRWLSVWGLIGVPLWIVAELLAFLRVGESSAIAVVLEVPIALQESTMAIRLIRKGISLPSSEKVS